MSGALIVEYRDGENVTRVERAVYRGGFRSSSSRPERADLQVVLAATSQQVVDAALPIGLDQ